MIAAAMGGFRPASADTFMATPSRGARCGQRRPTIKQLLARHEFTRGFHFGKGQNRFDPLILPDWDAVRPGELPSPKFDRHED